ncbi:CGNR zinc finger domain-containing protein [Streptomyces sp. NPDC059788]|uniref:CGNR zinc finger domain-containing protein n=1 Tax=Streptomyces sp. NPDC059788 TaxID=3346948 RepID=UPI0036541474
MQATARRTAALVNALTGEAAAPAPATIAALLREHGESTDFSDSSKSGKPEGTGAPAKASAPAKAGAPATAGASESAIALSATDVAEMRSAALLLREVFTADGTGPAAEALNRLLRRTAGTLRLTSHDGASPWHPHLDSDDDAPWGEWFLASSCLCLMALIWHHQRPPGGVCASSTCDNVYLALGSGLPRRYCSRRCATRERVAAHRRSQP